MSSDLIMYLSHFLRREIQQLHIAPALEIHDGPSRLIALNGIIIRLIEYICKDAARIFLVDLCKEKEYTKVLLEFGKNEYYKIVR